MFCALSISDNCYTSSSFSLVMVFLQDDHLVVVSPGGLREAQFSDSMYKVLWGKRSGFARVAKEANVVCAIFN